jgi:hypothetical protein
VDFNVDVFSDKFRLLQRVAQSNSSGYPADYQRVDQKTLPVINQLPVLSGCDVLEVGSNYGMYSLLMSPIANLVYALEPDKAIHSVSLSWRHFFESDGYTFENVQFLNKGVSHAPDVSYNALLLTLVLYHLTNDEIDILLDDARTKAERIVIQCRPARMLARQKGSFSGYVSKNSRFDGLFDIAGNIRFLKEIGMRSVSVSVSEQLLGDEVFPVIVGRR